MTQNVRTSTGRGARSFRRGGRPARTASLLWRGIASTGLTTVNAGVQAVVEILDTSLDDIADSTIMRILGSLTMKCGAPNQNVFWRGGLFVMTDDAFIAGGNPEPWLDPVQWMWEDAGWLTTTNTSDVSQMARVPVDVRVRRRMPKSNQSLAFIIDNLAGSGTTLQFHVNLKCLCRVP